MNEQRIRDFSAAKIAYVLFKERGFDHDKAIPIAYWFKHGRMIAHGEARYVAAWDRWAGGSRRPDLPEISEGQARAMLAAYDRFKRGLVDRKAVPTCVGCSKACRTAYCDDCAPPPREAESRNRSDFRSASQVPQPEGRVTQSGALVVTRGGRYRKPMTHGSD
jgi:hypothetical protein